MRVKLPLYIHSGIIICVTKRKCQKTKGLQKKTGTILKRKWRDGDCHFLKDFLHYFDEICVGILKTLSETGMKERGGRNKCKPIFTNKLTMKEEKV